ncbi:MAG: DUF6612 family protein [Thermincolia bacterium]
MLKRLCTVVLTLVLMFGVSTVAMANQQVKIKINGKNLTTDVDPVIKGKRTLVPLRAISEALGADVTYDATTKKITIVKLQDTYIFTVGQKQVLKNGARLQDLDVPAQTISGRTLVPVRFVSEVLGAKVDWDKNTFIVSIIHDEKRNGLSPVEYYLKVNEAVYKQESMKFKGKGKVAVQLPDMPSLEAELEVDSAFKKPQEVWAKVYVIPSGELKLTGMEPVSFEMYINGLKSYMKENGQWKELPSTSQEAILPEFLTNDPAFAAQVLEELGFILSYGNDGIIDGKTYNTLNIRLDQSKFMKFMDTIMAANPVTTPGMTPEEAQKAQEAAKEVMKNMKFDFSYKIFIDRDTLLMKNVEFKGVMNMAVVGQEMSINFDFKGNSEYGGSVTMPEVTKK